MAELTKHDQIDDYPYLAYAQKSNASIGKPFTVTVKDDTLQVDFTFIDIVRAFESGIAPVLRFVHEKPVFCSIVSAYYDEDNDKYTVVFMLNGEQMGVVADDPNEPMSYGELQ